MNILGLYVCLVFVPQLNAASKALIFTCVALMVLSGVVGTAGEHRAWEFFRFIYKIFIVSVICFIVLPDNKDMYTLTGAYIEVNTKQVSTLPPNVLKAVNDYVAQIKPTIGVK